MKDSVWAAKAASGIEEYPTSYISIGILRQTKRPDGPAVAPASDEAGCRRPFSRTAESELSQHRIVAANVQLPFRRLNPERSSRY